jgi:Leucine-rich repeat (LRR) protein
MRALFLATGARPANEVGASRKRSFRVSLRALLLLVTGVCLWLRKLSFDAGLQRGAVQWVREHGGQVTYDWEAQSPRGNRRQKKSPQPWPAWTRRVFPEHLFQTVTTARVTHMRGVDMLPVARFEDVEELDLTSNGMSDLRPLAKLRRLKRLVLVDNDISDLSPLAGLTQLEELNLSYNEISDLSALRGLTKLSRLYLQHNRLAEAAALSGLPKLREIDLDRNLLPNWR